MRCLTVLTHRTVICSLTFSIILVVIAFGIDVASTHLGKTWSSRAGEVLSKGYASDFSALNLEKVAHVALSACDSGAMEVTEGGIAVVLSAALRLLVRIVSALLLGKSMIRQRLSYSLSSTS
jgi:hypothetical protein